VKRNAAIATAFLVLCLSVGSAPAMASGDWSWPVVGPILRGFDDGDSPYSAGHRGIDIGAPIGTVIHSPATGVVSFSGRVGGYLYISIDHPGGVRSTFSWLTSSVVRKGQSVAVGEVIGTTGLGHPGSTTPHLHLGTRIGGVYVDPLSLLAPLDLSGLIRLVPMAWRASPYNGPPD